MSLIFEEDLIDCIDVSPPFLAKILFLVLEISNKLNFFNKELGYQFSRCVLYGVNQIIGANIDLEAIISRKGQISFLEIIRHDHFNEAIVVE